jgi:hypothetical protein
MKDSLHSEYDDLISLLYLPAHTWMPEHLITKAKTLFFGAFKVIHLLGACTANTVMSIAFISA